MFGYLTAYQDRLSEEDRSVYQGYYCGLCRTLSEKFGKKSALVLAYDPVFLAILYTSLYETAEESGTRWCLYKGSRVPMVRAGSLSYAADMNLLLAYYNYSDQVHDSKKKKALRALHFLEKEARGTEEKYPRQARALREYMKALHDCEARGSDNPDEAADLTGQMCAEVFLSREDEYARYLRPMFFHLGKYIYLIDAFCDLPEDLQSGSYNPYRSLAEEPERDELIRMHLESVMGACTREFEKLPIFLHRDILRNILYAGVWIGFRKAAEDRKKKETEQHVL